MFRSLILAIAVLAAVPPLASADEITLLPAIKLQIGDRDNYGNYWDGDRWRDRDYWRRHYDWDEGHWRPHDHGRHRGWEHGRDFDRGYRAGWEDHDDHGGHWRH